ncbi:MAG TPA: hypothetical protein VF474_15280 [Phenylobacterium sp.]
MTMTFKLVKASTRISRVRPPKEAALISRHARQVGEIMFAWNGLQSALFEVFAALTDDDRYRARASREWHGMRSDKARRDALLAEATARLAAQPKLLAELRWVHGCARDLSPHRNRIAHTPMWMAVVGVQAEVFPDLIGAGSRDVVSLVEAPVATTWRALRGDLYALTAFTRLIAVQLTDPHAMPLTFPRRPPFSSR